MNVKVTRQAYNLIKYDPDWGLKAESWWRAMSQQSRELVIDISKSIEDARLLHSLRGLIIPQSLFEINANTGKLLSTLALEGKALAEDKGAAQLVVAEDIIQVQRELYQEIAALQAKIKTLALEKKVLETTIKETADKLDLRQSTIAAKANIIARKVLAGEGAALGPKPSRLEQDVASLSAKGKTQLLEIATGGDQVLAGAAYFVLDLLYGRPSTLTPPAGPAPEWSRGYEMAKRLSED